jgi:hypothetical protein
MWKYPLKRVNSSRPSRSRRHYASGAVAVSGSSGYGYAFALSTTVERQSASPTLMYWIRSISAFHELADGALPGLVEELCAQQHEAAKVDAAIAANLEDLGYGR